MSAIIPLLLATALSGVALGIPQPPPLPLPNSKVVICNYETKSHLREGQGKFELANLEPALQYCTHLIYGYAAIKEETLKLVPLNEQFDVIKDNYRQVTNLKIKYPRLKILLSVGGNDDVSGEGAEKNLKYRQVLESSAHRLAFINSAHTIVKGFGFDGIDLAWEFPETKPKKIKSGFKKFWSSFKKTFTGETVIDEDADKHRDQFTSLLRELKSTFKPDNLMVTLTVLPNVNSTVYYDPRAIAPNTDFVILHAFDFYTPERNPKLADFPAPLYDLIDRRPDENVDSWVKYWLGKGFPANKLILGIPTYGRTWKLDEDAKIDTVPPEGLDGAGPPGPQTKDAGILSYPEICVRVQGGGNVSPQGYRKIVDVTKRRGSYAYKLPNPDTDEEGIWIGYEDPDSATNKATYVRNKGLAGIALDDLTLDDFRGVCTRDKYSILKAAVAGL
ncbi:chitinase-like protein Idgf4 [Rhynchophorus ferrugineus]|uniref:chitinase-like protein Idgf4 n=1 Tax=Rhynchophorus ferrugineus TaxID=354439 RepID=UPI003FCC6A42